MSLKRWTCVILVGVAYGVVGVALTEMSKRFATDQFRAWRLAAWIVSAVIFAGHFFYEQFRVEQRSLSVALHTALAVALGAFLLALAAIIHATMVVSHAPYWLFAIALVAWPLLTGIPAFVVALFASLGVVRLKLNHVV
jgi:hypothetical protein